MSKYKVAIVILVIVVIIIAIVLMVIYRDKIKDLIDGNNSPTTTTTGALITQPSTTQETTTTGALINQPSTTQETTTTTTTGALINQPSTTQETTTTGALINQPSTTQATTTTGALITQAKLITQPLTTQAKLLTSPSVRILTSQETTTTGALINQPSTTQETTTTTTTGALINQPSITKAYTWENKDTSGNKIQGGYESNGTPLYVCQINKEEDKYVHPGKIVGENCNIEWGGQEFSSPDYTILTSNTPSNLSWTSTPSDINKVVSSEPVPANVVFTGLPVCRADAYNGKHIGKVWDNACYLGYGGAAHVTNTFEYLVNR